MKQILLAILLATGLCSVAHAGCFGKAATIRPLLINWDNFDGYTVPGTPGPDVIVSGYYNDQIFGGSGNDLICGSRGFDYIDGGRGFDKCYGGPGPYRDVFVSCNVVIE